MILFGGDFNHLARDECRMNLQTGEDIQHFEPLVQVFEQQLAKYPECVGYAPAVSVSTVAPLQQKQ